MKKIVAILMTLLLLAALAVPAMAAQMGDYVVDDADLLTDYEEQKLEAALADLSEKWDMSFVLVTTDDTGSKSSNAYADDFFDYGGYGYDGILWLIDMDHRKSTISTTGYGITVFTDAGQEYMQDIIAPMLTDGDYAYAAERFIDLCDDYCRQAEEGSPYDNGNMPNDEFDSFGALLISLLLGLIAALLTTTIMKGQLNNVHAKVAATDYVKPGSLQVTEARDLFLYRNVTRTVRAKESSGSSTHSSSSGSSHGGSSRSF